MALTPAVVDIPVGSLNSTPPDHAGAQGRMTAIYDAAIVHYQEATANTPKKVLLDPRAGFTSLSTDLRSVLTGATETPPTARPELLAPIGDQLVALSSMRPRVFNGTDWSSYSANRVVAGRLTEQVIHTSDRTIAAPSHTWLNSVKCCVWTEQQAQADGTFIGSSWIGFQSDDGAWIRTPQTLYAPNSSSVYCLAKVVTDGTLFWAVFNSGSGLTIRCYDTHGQQLATTNLARPWVRSPGYWDVYGSVLAGVIIAQPDDNGPGDVNVRFTTVTYNSMTVAIDKVTTSDGTAHCSGPLTWVTNDLTNAYAYLATIGEGEGAGGRLWGYEVNPATGLTTHAYDTTVEFAICPDSIVGYSYSSTGGVALMLVYSLPAAAQTVGPTYDPATRNMSAVSTLRGGTVDSAIRSTLGVTAQSRAFAIDDEYFCYTYYQSGSGQNLPSAPVEITHTAGDYIIGSPVQTLHITSGGTFGAPQPATLSAIFTGAAALTFSIASPDKVEAVTASGIAGITDGTPILKWSLANSTAALGHTGYILKLTGTSIASANFSWDIIAEGSLVLYTPTTNRAGGTVVPGTFSAAGGQSGEYTRTARYVVGDLPTVMPTDVADLFLPNGTVVVTGASSGGNNGTFTLIERDPLMVSADIAAGYPVPSSIYTLLTTQVVDTAFAGSFAISPAQPDTWFELGDVLTAADVNSTLQVTNNPVTSNNSLEYPVTAVPTDAYLTIDATADAATVAQHFAAPLPSMKLAIPGSQASGKLYLQAATLDYSYIGALVSISGANHGADNAVYRIVTVQDSHTAIVERTDGVNDWRSEAFDSEVTVFIQRSTGVEPEFQPCWFLTPLTGAQPQVGCFEKGLAYADWRFDGESTPQDRNRYHMALSNVSYPFGTGHKVVLPYRAISFTQATVATVGSTQLNIANLSSQSTVGLKAFQLDNPGVFPVQANGLQGQLLIPGPLATEYTGSGFHESNVNVGPEAPWIVSEGTDSSTTFALSPGFTYSYQVVATVTDENGQRVLSLPSPILTVPLTGTSNYAVIGGRTINPLDGTGQVIPGVYGLSNHAKITYSIYRTVIVNGQPSTGLRLITQLDNPNGLAGSAGGFSFPDSFTWNYRDQVPDAVAQAGEVVYAGRLGQGQAPRFPAPAHSTSCVWANRRWVVGYDGAVWPSGEFVEGEAEWFFPGFRFPFPPEDPATAVVGFENYLFIFCAKSVWRLPLAEFPNATLTAGAWPTPVKLPTATGCTGLAVPMLNFVAYVASTDNGSQVWALTRDLENVYLSQPVADQITQPITNLYVDGQQRLLASYGGTKLFVYDPIPKEWYTWRMPSVTSLVSAYQKQPCYMDSAAIVMQQQDSAIVDTRAGTPSNVAIDATYSSLSFASVRAVKRLWEVQALGAYHGPCNINAVIGCPDDLPNTTSTFGPALLDPSAPCLVALNPLEEEATTWTVRIFGSYEGILSPGRCFSLEMISCEVGLDPSMGLNKLPNGFRLVGR